MKAEDPKPITKPIDIANLSLETLKSMFPESFDTIGNIEGKVKLHLKEDADPYIAAPRKGAIHTRDQVMAELDSMEKKA